MKLDYTLNTPEERKTLVEQCLAESPNPTNAYLETMADYLISSIEKQERKDKVLNENRLTTINRHEISLEGLEATFENSHDTIYNLASEDKNTIFYPKISITKQDVEEIPGLKQLRESIKYWEELLKTKSGHEAFIIKRTIIELRKDQYVLKEAYRRPIHLQKITRSKNSVPLEAETQVEDNGTITFSGVSLVNPEVVSAILCNYSLLKEAAWGEFDKDVWYLMNEFDNVADRALKEYPMYEKIVEYKIDGLQNVQIQEKIEQEFGVKYSFEYISSLWRNKIPKIIASAAEDIELDYYYLEEAKGVYKRCNKCGQVKLAHPKYFSKNNTSKDGFYSVCRSCRKKKTKGEN